MATLGIVLLSAHYPAMTPKPGLLDRRIVRSLESQGIAASRIRLYPVHEDALPVDPTECDAWIVSGPRDLLTEPDPRREAQLAGFFRRVVSERRPLFAVYRAERTVFEALTGLVDREREGQYVPTGVRNPLCVFQECDRLYRWDRASDSLRDITLPPSSSEFRVRIRAFLRVLAA